MNLMRKISKRIHPVSLIKYDIRKNRNGFRKEKQAKKHGDPIECDSIDHIHIYQTLRCNLKCSFCINRLAVEKIFNYQEEPFSEWSDLINRLHGVRELYFNGGEHFILHGFGDFINSLDGFNIRIFTNFPKQGAEEFKKLDAKRNNIVLLISYHPHTGEPVANFVKRCNESIPKGILWNPHIIRANGVSTRMYADAFNRFGIYPTSEELVLPFMNDANIKKVLCKTNEWILAPDMRLYKCMIHMLQGLDNGNYNYENGFKSSLINCDFYPRCSGCNAYNEIMNSL